MDPEVLEDGPWRFLLHCDTTLFHTMHPTLEDGLLVLPVERTAGPDLVETLRFDLQDLRSDGALLTLAWGYERISVELGVDPGFVTTVSDAGAARYVGDWILDQDHGRPLRRDAGRHPGEPPGGGASVSSATSPRRVSPACGNSTSTKTAGRCRW